jgi:hypothetical protein
MNLKYHLPKQYSPAELLKIFPEAKEIIPEKLREWKLNLKKKERAIGNILTNIYGRGLDATSGMLAEEAVKVFLLPELIECDRQISRLNRLMSLLCNDGQNKIDYSEKIERARNFPIQEITNQFISLRQSGKNSSGLCPFHNEKHASFYIYPETNTFHCFGCQANGDVIKLTMHLHGINFKEAVRMLQ